MYLNNKSNKTERESMLINNQIKRWKITFLWHLTDATKPIGGKLQKAVHANFIPRVKMHSQGDYSYLYSRTNKIRVIKRRKKLLLRTTDGKKKTESPQYFNSKTHSAKRRGRGRISFLFPIRSTLLFRRTCSPQLGFTFHLLQAFPKYIRRTEFF